MKLHPIIQICVMMLLGLSMMITSVGIGKGQDWSFITFTVGMGFAVGSLISMIKEIKSLDPEGDADK